MSDTVKCPFCGEGDYDLVGLKHHLTGFHIFSGEYGGCDKFKATLTTEEERQLMDTQKQYQKEHESE